MLKCILKYRNSRYVRASPMNFACVCTSTVTVTCTIAWRPKYIQPLFLKEYNSSVNAVTSNLWIYCTRHSRKIETDQCLWPVDCACVRAFVCGVICAGFCIGRRTTGNGLGTTAVAPSTRVSSMVVVVVAFGSLVCEPQELKLRRNSYCTSGKRFYCWPVASC